MLAVLLFCLGDNFYTFIIADLLREHLLINMDSVSPFLS